MATERAISRISRCSNLKEMIDENDPVVVSVPLLKKADEMRTLAQKIQGRLRSDYGK
jgi:hypothetical protein